MKQIMEDDKTKDKSLDQKVILMKRKFGYDLSISRSTVWNVRILVVIMKIF